MNGKLVYDLFITTDNTDLTTVNSAPVPMGGNNFAMFEVWLKSASGLLASGVRATLEASNDGQNWSKYVFGGTSGTLTGVTNTTTPSYLSMSTTNTAVMPFSQVRLKFSFTSATAGQAALVDGSIRTYRRS